MKGITRIGVALTIGAGSVLAQSGNIVVPAATATGIGLASAANYELTKNGKWKKRP